MHIQFNTDNHILGSEKLREQLEPLIIEQLKRFSEQITRVEVHLNDENSHKPGQDDIRCMLEARLEGMDPVAVTNFAQNQQVALKGALTKLKSALETRTGKLKSY